MHEYRHDSFVLYVAGLSPCCAVRKGEPDWYHQSRAVSERRLANAINKFESCCRARKMRLSASSRVAARWHPMGLHGSRAADAMVESWKCSSDGTGPSEKKISAHWRLARALSQARLYRYNELDDPRKLDNERGVSTSVFVK